MTEKEFQECMRVSARGNLASDFMKSDFWLIHLKPYWQQRPLELDREWFDPSKRNALAATESALFNSGRHQEIEYQLQTLERWVKEGQEADEEMEIWKEEHKRESQRKKIYGVTPL